jgi:hypothetical protein
MVNVSFALPGFRKRRLRRQTNSIDSFRLEACIGEASVRAVWNGRQLRMSDRLHRMAELAVAIDELYLEAGLEKSAHRSTLDGCPEAVMLTLINCCDAVDVAEYSTAGRRRLLSP